MVKQFIFVPWWIAEVLQRRGIPFADITNFKVLRQALSYRDLSQLWELQFVMPEKFIPPSNGVMDGPDVRLSSQWDESVRGDPEAKAALDVFYSTHVNDGGPGAEAMARIAESVGDVDPNNQKDPFILYDIPPAFAVLVINEGFSVNDPALRVRAVEEMVKLSYVHAPFSELASRSRWYACYLNLLATRQSA